MGNNVIPTALNGVVIIEPQVFRDDRGFFLESYHHQRWSDLGITVNFVQDNHSRSQRGVLRGLHYQDMSAPMAKLVRCTRGGVFDVAVDLQVGSPTFGQWFGVELTEENNRQLFVPVGFAHGFVALSDVTDIQYKCSNFYTPPAEDAVLWNDPEIGVAWPVTDPILSQRDQRAISLQQYQERPAFHYRSPGVSS